MPIIHMLKGLPASGKSTYAKQLIKDNEDNMCWVRLNNDDLSQMLFGSSFVKKSGELLEVCRKQLLNTLMVKGKNIIIDNTNLTEARQLELETLIAEHNLREGPYKYKLTIKDFTDVSIYDCLKRNKLRENPIPERVICDMYNQHVVKQPKVNEELQLPSCIVVDIDGTIADCTGIRNPYDTAGADRDLPIKNIISLIKVYITQGHKLIFLTGRDEKHRALTVSWLKQVAMFSGDDLSLTELVTKEGFGLLMRPDNLKTTSAALFKQTILLTEILPKFNVTHWFEDKLDCVEMARKVLGSSRVLQVGKPI